MEKQLIKALRETMREELLRQHAIEIDGLGRFEAVHKEQHQKRTEDGKTVMMPPQDRIVFTPEIDEKG